MNKFDRDLSYGQYAELYIGAVHPTWVRNGGLGVDFTLPNGKTLELKAERRSSWETANIAVEIESSPGTPGAIYRAKAEGAAYIAYLFADNAFFIYTVDEVLKKLEGKRVISVPNANYDTKIVLVPRAELRAVPIEDL